jgi:hypothetical protein
MRNDQIDSVQCRQDSQDPDERDEDRYGGDEAVGLAGDEGRTGTGKGRVGGKGDLARGG